MAFAQSVFSNVAPHIRIHYNQPTELIAIEGAIQKLKSREKGAQLLDLLNSVTRDHKRVHIAISTDGGTDFSAELTAQQVKKYNINPDPTSDEHFEFVHNISCVQPNGEKGEGAMPVISFNPNKSIHIDNEGFPYYVNDKTQSFVCLAHEMIHAFHTLNGTSTATDPDDNFPGSGQEFEEHRAVGMGIHANNTLSENVIRREHGLPLRAHYFLRPR